MGSSQVMDTKKGLGAREEIRRGVVDGAGRDRNQTTLLSQGSHGVMEQSNNGLDAREMIRRKELYEEQSGEGNVSILNQGSQGIMKNEARISAREQILRKDL